VELGAQLIISAGASN